MFIASVSQLGLIPPLSDGLLNPLHLITKAAGYWSKEINARTELYDQDMDDQKFAMEGDNDCSSACFLAARFELTQGLHLYYLPHDDAGTAKRHFSQLVAVRHKLRTWGFSCPKVGSLHNTPVRGDPYVALKLSPLP